MRYRNLLWIACFVLNQKLALAQTVQSHVSEVPVSVNHSPSLSLPAIIAISSLIPCFLLAGSTIITFKVLCRGNYFQRPLPPVTTPHDLANRGVYVPPPQTLAQAPLDVLMVPGSFTGGVMPVTTESLTSNSLPEFFRVTQWVSEVAAVRGELPEGANLAVSYATVSVGGLTTDLESGRAL